MRAAFYALLDSLDVNTERNKHLHAFALVERSSDECDTLIPFKPRKNSKRKS